MTQPQMHVSAYRQSRPSHGFTLIEVIVVMTMLAILAAIAIPNYSDYVLRSHRSSAQSFVADVASRQAQFFLDRRTYAATVAALNLTAPPELAARYAFAINVDAGPPPGFQITATPIGVQVDDRCGALTINQAGAKGAAGTRCW